MLSLLFAFFVIDKASHVKPEQENSQRIQAEVVGVVFILNWNYLVKARQNIWIASLKWEPGKDRKGL